jgi:hypothetical protein
MIALERKMVGEIHDIAYYAKDGRLTAEPDGKRYRWRDMIDAVKKIGRPLTDEEAEEYRIKYKIQNCRMPALSYNKAGILFHLSYRIPLP